MHERLNISPETDWRKMSHGNSLMFSDNYSIRYIEICEYRSEAFKYHLSSCQYSDRVAFWNKHYATPEDAIIAAKQWLLRGELSKEPATREGTYRLASGLFRQPSPELVAQGW